MEFEIIHFNVIQNYISKLHSKSYLSMKFKIIACNGIQNHIFEYSFYILIIFKTALYLAVDEGNVEIVKLLVTNDKLDINFLNIFHNF